MMDVDVDGSATDLAAVLDVARSRIDELETRGYRCQRLSVPRGVYDALATIKRAEVARAGAVFLLGLEVVARPDRRGGGA